jgi:hypothetical protein
MGIEFVHAHGETTAPDICLQQQSFEAFDRVPAASDTSIHCDLIEPARQHPDKSI